MKKAKIESHKYIDYGHVERPKFTRRLVSSLLDLILFVVTTTIIFVFISQPIAMKNRSYKTKINAAQAIMIRSGLYVEKDFDLLKIYNSEFSLLVLDERLATFYCEFATCADYLARKAEHVASDAGQLFTYNEITNDYSLIIGNEESETYRVWLEEEIDYAIINVLQTESEWRDAYYGMIQAILAIIIFTAILTSLIIYLLIPLFNFGRTIGERLMGLSIYALQVEDINPTPNDLVKRYISIIFINLLFGILSIGIIPLISLLIDLKTHKGTFVERISKTNLTTFYEHQADGFDSFSQKALYGEDEENDI